MRSRWILLFGLLLFSNVFALTHLSSSTQKLKRVDAKITQVKTHLNTLNQKKVDLLRDLKSSELQIARATKSLNVVARNLRKEKKAFEKTKGRLSFYEDQLNAQKKLLSEQLRSLYLLGREPLFKILLNQENPEKVSRYLQYYRYVNQARLDMILNIQHTAAKIVETSSMLKKQLDQLNVSYQKQLSEKKQLKIARLSRKRALYRAKRQVNVKKRELKQLLKNKKKLTNIISELKFMGEYGLLSGKRFNQLKHQLNWPILSGNVVQYFGQSLEDGRIRSDGIVIRSKKGTDIRAIFPGKVLFANWLNGYGLLVIVQHDQRFLTLYGRAETLNIKAGEQVKAGAILGQVGNSGGYQKDGLYFEIRDRAKPVNPVIWLKRKR